MYKDILNKEGYFILRDVLTKEEVEEYKNLTVDYIKNNRQICHAKGITIPDFMKRPQFSKLSELVNNKNIHAMLKEVFGENYRYCGHNDIGINRIAGWHKDKLNPPYGKYETVDIWEEKDGEKHEIIKVLIYLQDHSNDNDGLKVVPGSQHKKTYETDDYVQLKPRLGDAIVFDQRITHRGMEKQVLRPRILVSLGFGRNNIFTDNFEKGTNARQNEQNKRKKFALHEGQFKSFNKIFLDK